MTITEIEQDVKQYVIECANSPALGDILPETRPYVVKYMPARHLAAVLSLGQFYASERAGFTWGDAIYVAPLSRPLSRAGRRFFDARKPRGIDLYQEWIRHQTRLYRELTTTVHASAANRDLRNAFRTRFAIDCVFISPDEICQAYVDAANDCWLAVTHWDAQQTVGNGFSPAVTE